MPAHAQTSRASPSTVHIHRPLQTILHPSSSTNSSTNTSTSSSCRVPAEQLAAAGLHLPLLAKTLRTDSEGDSHGIGVVHTREGLAALQQGAVPQLPLPLVLQQFVPHGERLYKVGCSWCWCDLGTGSLSVEKEMQVQWSMAYRSTDAAFLHTLVATLPQRLHVLMYVDGVSLTSHCQALTRRLIHSLNCSGTASPMLMCMLVTSWLLK